MQIFNGADNCSQLEQQCFLTRPVAEVGVKSGDEIIPMRQ